MSDVRNIYRISGRKFEGKRQMRRPRLRWDRVGSEDVAQDGVQ
jgi:hypothetical protein